MPEQVNDGLNTEELEVVQSKKVSAIGNLNAILNSLVKISVDLKSGELDLGGFFNKGKISRDEALAFLNNHIEELKNAIVLSTRDINKCQKSLDDQSIITQELEEKVRSLTNKLRASDAIAKELRKSKEDVTNDLINANKKHNNCKNKLESIRTEINNVKRTGITVNKKKYEDMLKALRVENEELKKKLAEKCKRKNNRRMFTCEDVKEIFRLSHDGMSHSEISKKYNSARSTISRILNKSTYSSCLENGEEL